MINSTINMNMRFWSTVITIFFMHTLAFSQSPPNLGVASTFALFTSVGAFNNTGASMIKGDIGTNVGAFTGFPPGTVLGSIHVADAVSAQAAIDVDAAYSYLSGVTCGLSISTTLGGGQILTPNVYCLGAASTLSGELILDAQGNPNSIFIFKINGAFSTATFSKIILVGDASLCNVYWQINGQFELGDGSVFRGTVVSNGAIILLEASSLIGNALSRAGAISTHNNLVTIGLQPSAASITANGATSFCAGGSVTLSGNIDGTWSTGATTPSITVSTSGDYFVTNTSNCGTINSNHIIVTVNPNPTATISANGPTTFCAGGNVILTASAGNSFLWNTGATTKSITISSSGNFIVTVTDANGCTGISATTTIIVSPIIIPTISANGPITFCAGGNVILTSTPSNGYLWSTGATTQSISITTSGSYAVTITGACGGASAATVVTVNPLPFCSIIGNNTICNGGSTQLCAIAGVASYLWSTGVTTQCINASTAGTFTVTVTNLGGCKSSCSISVTVNNNPTCLITGINTICSGGSTQLCGAAGGASYLWSTGASTQCINVNAAGTYTITVTNLMGCSSNCSKSITVNNNPTCSITGNNTICTGGTTQLCAAAGATSYLWNSGASTQCITANIAGTYTVSITNLVGCSSSCTKTITPITTPSCIISGNATICTGGSTQLCAAAGAASYLWSTGATTQCITVNSAGTFTVTATNLGGCSNICNQTVSINNIPICSITGNSTICIGGSTQLCAAAGAASYLWSTGATMPCINVNAEGTYTITVTNAGGCSAVCNKTITISAPPSCTISGISSFCSGGSTQLCAASGSASYLWSTGASTQCIAVNSAGTFTVTATNLGGCSSMCSQAVTVNNIPTCSITGNSIICTGGSTQLCAAAGAASYLWSTGASTQCITANAAINYTVTITNIGGCKNSCTQAVTVNNNPTCLITGNNTICSGGSTQLCAAAGAASYLWSTGASTECITANSAGTYSVTVTNFGGCS
ncbi:MAG: ice-binding family protein, partial [Saprospiraceae bacterium]